MFQLIKQKSSKMDVSQFVMNPSYIHKVFCLEIFMSLEKPLKLSLHKQLQWSAWRLKYKNDGILQIHPHKKRKSNMKSLYFICSFFPVLYYSKIDMNQFLLSNLIHVKLCNQVINQDEPLIKKYSFLHQGESLCLHRAGQNIITNA